MPPRPPGIHTHEEWKGMANPVGLVVEPVVLNRLGIFPESATAVLADWQRRLDELLQDQQLPESGEWASVAPSFAAFVAEVLGWQEGDLQAASALEPSIAVQLDDYNETLAPTWVVNAPDGVPQLLVQELPIGTDFDAIPKGVDGRRQWEASPQQRFERLLKESEHPIGVLWNGAALRLVYAPRGESSGHLSFPLEPMTTVDGRPMLAALQMLLGPDRLFEGGSSATRLKPLMVASRKEQNEVSTRLAEQVLEALWILVKGFDAAGAPQAEPQHIYGGLITVLLRLVFLLYAEDEELMPVDSLYGQHYSVSGLALRLRQDRAEHQNQMEGRRGAWAGLLSLFRLVYDGGGPTKAYLPARHGELFDPDAYPFLEGRILGSHYKDDPIEAVPAISDDVVEQVLTKLLVLGGQILNYRALDVEQIGSVYEGIMGFQVESASGPSLGITHRPPRQKITITVVVNAEDLLAQATAKRANWLDERAGVKLKLAAPIARALKEATSQEDLAAALGNRLSPHTPRLLPKSSLVLQPTEERRRSGSHYTPRALTEPIVAEALRPWLERCNGKPTAEQVLNLKLCDPAMGSGAFLVAVCRFLARWLVAAWENPEGPGFPPEFKKEWDKDLYARRLIAQRCLYGVDKNPFAVNLAKLSLWLVTLSKELPFTFVDHALKCGDSLVGYSMRDIQAAMKDVQLGFLNQQNQIYAEMGIARRESFSGDSRNDAAYDRKKQLLERQIHASEGLRAAGDLMVAAFFAGSKPRERADKQQVYLAMLSGAFGDDGLRDNIKEIRQELAVGEKGIRPLHWDLEFPEVFSGERGGFDVFVGNPPFVGNNGFTSFYPDGILDFLRRLFPGSGGRADYVVYFIRKCFEELRGGGALGLITTNKICQGDTRESGLEWICCNGGSIFSSIRRLPWPGVASVVVSIAHILKDIYTGPIFLDGKDATRINAFLLEGFTDVAPPALALNSGMTYTGVKTYSQSFLFDSSDDADIETPGTPLPLPLAESLCKQYPSLVEFIRPYTGAEEVNASPTHASRRMAIYFGNLSLDECNERWPDLMQILELKVKPDRASSRNAEVRAWPWWRYWRPRIEMFERLHNLEQAIVTSASAVSHHMFSLVPSSIIFSQKCVVITSSSELLLCALQSLFHEEWSRLFGTTQGASDALTYNATDVFCNYPFPSESYLRLSSEVPLWAKEFADKRSSLYRSLGLGPTKAYGRMHSPLHQDETTISFRAIHEEINNKLLDDYGWNDIALRYGFRLEGLDSDDSIPDGLTGINERIEKQDFFFSCPQECRYFQSEYESIVESPVSLSWRYGWPDEVRDEVLARLLALNAERYAEEVNLGLHAGGRSRASGNGAAAPGGSGKRRGRPPKATQAADTEQIGLAL